MTTTRTQSPDPLRKLRALQDRERQLASTKRELIAQAREQGHSWSEIGATLGVSKQAAWQLYNDEITAILDNVAQRANLTEDEAAQLAREEIAATRKEQRPRPST